MKLMHLGIFIQHVVKPQFPESAPRLFDLLFGSVYAALHQADQRFLKED
jgi:hypothetical protein